MAAIDWPVSLPQRPTVNGYQRKPGVQMLRSQMDVGPPKVRRRFTTAPDVFRVRFVVTSTELATFMTFYKTTSGGGTIAFDVPHPDTGATVEMRFTEEAPLIRAVSAGAYSIECTWEENIT